jgi:hypothetical protein
MDDHAIIEQAVERFKSGSDSELLRRSGNDRAATMKCKRNMTDA